MEEGRWAARVLSEIGAARAAIAANYLRLWRADGHPLDEEAVDPPPTPFVDAEQASTAPDLEETSPL